MKSPGPLELQMSRKRAVCAGCLRSMKREEDLWIAWNELVCLTCFGALAVPRYGGVVATGPQIVHQLRRTRMLHELLYLIKRLRSI